MYVGWFGKPNSVNGGGFTEIFSSGSNTNGGTANNPAIVNATLDWVQNRLGRQPSLFHLYEDAGGKGDFPATAAGACAQRQQLLMVSLSLGPLTAKQLSHGKGDALWRNWAQGARAWGKPVILRWGWEAPIQPWARDPAAYKAAWLRMHRIIKQEVGAANVKLAYTPVYFGTAWGTYRDYFPGNAYVDWVGVDDFQPPDKGFEDTIQAPYDWFAQHAPGKPFIVAEWGMKHTSDDGQTTYAVPAYPNDWYCRTLAAAKTRPNIKAYVIFDFDQEIKSALSPTWPGTLNLLQQLQDPFYLQQAPVF